MLEGRCWGITHQVMYDSHRNITVVVHLLVAWLALHLLITIANLNLLMTNMA